MTALSDELPSDELIAAERPAFEAWCKSEGIDAELWIKGQPQCGYTNARTTDYWTGWIARARALLAAQPAVQQPAEDAPSDQVIELAGALEVRRILEAIKEVANLRPANDKITFDAAWQMCCQEIFYRATGCRWHMDEDATRFGRAAIKAQGGKQ